MNKHKSLERLRASISSALDLCSQLEAGRQYFAHRRNQVRTACNDVSHEVMPIRSCSRNRREIPSVLRREDDQIPVFRRQHDQVHAYQPARQDGINCPQHRGRLIPNGTSDPYEPAPTTPTHQHHDGYQVNENTNYGSMITRPCPFSPTRVCPRQGPCPYASTVSHVSGGFDSARRPCPYSPTNFCSRNGPCPYMPPPPPPPPPPPTTEDMVCPYVARMADAINQHQQSLSPPLSRSAGATCYRCRSRADSPTDNRCYSPTVCPLDPRPCIMSPRPCPFKPPDPPPMMPSTTYASAAPPGCPYASGISSARMRTYSEPMRCPFAV